MNQKSLRKIFILLVWTMGTSVLATDEIDFDQIDKALSDEVISQVTHYEALLTLAREGDKPSQVLLAYELQELAPEAAMTIARHVFETPDVALNESAVMLRYMMSALLSDLAETYLDANHPWFNPEQAFLLSTQHDLTITEKPPITWSLLYNAPWLPEVNHLMDAWRLHEEQNQIFTNLADWLIAFTDAADMPVEDAPVFNREEYVACPNVFGETQTVLAEHRRLQTQFIEDGQVDEKELAQYQQTMTRIESYASNTNVDFTLRSIGTVSVLYILLDLLNVVDRPDANPVELSEQVKQKLFFLHVYEINSHLMMALMLEQMNLEFLCKGNDIMLDHIAPSEHVSTMPLFIAGLVLEQATVENGDTFLRWAGGTEYRGQIRDLVPYGPGVMTIETGTPSETTYQGDFRGRQLNGEVSIYNTNGTMKYNGQMLDGLYHGPGRLYDRFTGEEFTGTFERGTFTGQGTMYMMDRLDSVSLHGIKFPVITVTYNGPIVRSEPHGQGACTHAEVNYPCTFYQGQLIGVGNASLIPGLNTLPVFE